MKFLYNLYLLFFNEKKNIVVEEKNEENEEKNESIYNYWIY